VRVQFGVVDQQNATAVAQKKTRYVYEESSPKSRAYLFTASDLNVAALSTVKKRY
jgi:hypothetical protein